MVHKLTAEHFQRPLLLVLTLWLFFALTCFALLYIVYKHHDYELVPGDHVHYLALTQKPLHNDVINPFKYRILSPILARALAAIGPSYRSPIASDFAPHDRNNLFYFCVVDYAFLCGAAALLTYILAIQFGFSFWAALCGGFVLMCSFPSVATSIMVSTDAGALFFILVAYIALQAQQRWAFASAILLGTLQKETVLVVMLALVVMSHVEKKRLPLFEYAVIFLALGAHLTHKALFPAPGFERYYDIAHITRNFFGMFLPATYPPTAVRHLLLANISLIAAGVAHAVLKLRGAAPLNFPVQTLLLVPGLFVFAMLFQDHANNAMRFIAFAAPFTIGYQIAVVSRVWHLLGLQSMAPEQTVVTGTDSSTQKVTTRNKSLSPQ